MMAKIRVYSRGGTSDETRKVIDEYFKLRFSTGKILYLLASHSGLRVVIIPPNATPAFEQSLAELLTNEGEEEMPALVLDRDVWFAPDGADEVTVN